MAGLNHVVALTKNLKDLDIKMNEATLKGQLIDLHLAVVELKGSVLELKNENLEKEMKITELQAQLNQKVDMSWEDPFYFKKSADGKKDGPFCQQCYDSKSTIVRLPKPDSDNPWYTCKTCTSSYNNPNYSPSSHNRTCDMRYDPLDY
ncbi:hypothetical protein ACNH6C_09930 [Bdellovibrio bacteriovorus]|uniref:hypothetical protein n=1 Tax=Bdellovibrio bacteriovorus TaxID=959 RepID=UPI003A7F66BD